MIGCILEGFDFSGLSQPQFSLNIQDDETDFHQQQQQFGSSEDFQSVQAQGNVRQQQQRLTQQPQPPHFQPQINTQQQPQKINQRFLPQQSQPQLQRTFQQQQQNFGSFHLEEMRQQQSQNSDNSNVRTSIQTDPNQITSHPNQPFTAFGQPSQKLDSSQQQSIQPNFQKPQIPQQPFNQQQDPQQQKTQQAFPQQQQTQQAFPQRFSFQKQDPRQQPQLPQSQQSSFQQPIQQQQQQSLSPPSSPPSQALNVFSSPNQFPSRPNIISSPEQPRSVNIFDQIRNSITNGVKFNSPSTFRPSTITFPTTTTTMSTTTLATTTAVRTTTTTKISTTASTTTTTVRTTTTISSAPIVISSFIEEYEDNESQEVETLPPTKKKSKKTLNKQEVNQSSVVEEINNIIDLISNFKTVSSEKTTTEELKLIETQENLLGLTAEGKSERQLGDLEFLPKLLINDEETLTDIKLEPQSPIEIQATTMKSLSEEEIDKLLENLLDVADSDEESRENELSSGEKVPETEEDYIDSVVENLVEDILNKELNIKEHEKKVNDFGAVERALTMILGKEPKKQNKISPDILATIIELDEFLRVEEEERQERVNRAKSLADRAIQLVAGSITKLKTKTGKKTSNRSFEEDDPNLDFLLKNFSKDQLRKLVLS